MRLIWVNIKIFQLKNNNKETTKLNFNNQSKSLLRYSCFHINSGRATWITKAKCLISPKPKKGYFDSGNNRQMRSSEWIRTTVLPASLATAAPSTPSAPVAASHHIHAVSGSRAPATPSFFHSATAPVHCKRKNN